MVNKLIAMIINESGSVCKQVLVFLFILTCPALYSQSQKIDSLLSIVEKREGIDKYDPLVGLTRELAKTDNLLAIKYGEQAYQLAHELGDSAKIVESSKMLGILFNRLSRVKEAESILLKALPVAKRNKLKEYLPILNSLGVAYTYQAKYEKALRYHFEYLKLHEVDSIWTEVSRSLFNIGVVYYKMKHSRKALEFYERSLALKRKYSDDTDFEGLLINIGLCCNALEKFSVAQEYFFSALDRCGQNCGSKDIINGEYGLGVSFYRLGEYSKALDHFSRSLQISQETGEQRFTADNLLFMARIFFKIKNPREAIKVLKDCEKIAVEFGYNELLITAYPELSKFFLAQNDYEEASHYQNKYINIRDSVYNEELTINLMRIEAEYMERENEAKIASQEQMLMLREAVIERQNLLNVFISLIAVILVILAIILFRSNNQRKMINQLLDLKVGERTRSLELNRNELLKAREERDLLLEKAAQNIRSSLASIKGICDIGRKDIEDTNALHYIREVDETTDFLSEMIQALPAHKASGSKWNSPN